MTKKYTLQQYAAMEGGHTMNDTTEQYSFLNTLGEARMFKSKHQISKEGARTVTDHFFVSMLSLYAMSNDYKYAPVAKNYAKNTNRFGNYNRPSPSGTDMYQSLHTILKPEGLINSEADKLLLNKVNLDQRKIRMFMKQIETGKVNPGQAQAFFYKLEKDLAIQDPKLRAARRLVGDWTNLTTNQQQLAATQINKHFRLNARRSDLFPIFSKYSSESGLEINDKEKQGIGKRIARGAAAFAAGYTGGKLTGM